MGRIHVCSERFYPPDFKSAKTQALSKPMTICIAALCEDSKQIVVAADRMITANLLSLQFEHPESKITQLTDSCVVMSAGAGLRITELVSRVRQKLSGYSVPPIAQIVEKVKEAYQEERRKKIEELFLSPRGLHWQDYFDNARVMVPEVAMTIDEQMATFDYGIELLVAGVDAEGGHIYYIHNPGSSECFDALGYYQIGSGEPHAAQCFIENRYSQKADLQHGVWCVYNGKKRAEDAPGVGKDGEFAVITTSGVRLLEQSSLTQLEELRNRMLSHEDDFVNKEVNPGLKSLKLSGDQP